MPRIPVRSLQTAAGVVAVTILLWWSSLPSTKTIVFPFNSRATNVVIPSTINSSWPERAEQSRAAFLRAYHAYEEHAFPADELLPESEEGSKHLNGWGLTTIDSLDTMYLMGFKPEFKRAREHVKKLDMTATDKFIPFFETTIRYLGGLIAAYVLTSDQLFLTKAEELAQILLPAFDTGSGLPQFQVNPSTRASKAGPQKHKASFSEIASFSLEFQTLAILTGKEEYALPVGTLLDILETTPTENGLWPTTWELASGKPQGFALAVGGNTDSAYEYLLKLYMNSHSAKIARDMYIRAANGIIETLIYISPYRHLMYATDIPNYKTGIPSNKFEHLTCFLPGLLALGVHSLHEHLSLRERRTHMYAAEGLAQTCWLLYADSTSGLGPDEVVFSRWPSPPAGGGGPDAGKGERDLGRWVDALAEWERGAVRWRKGGIWGKHEQADKLPPGVRNVEPVPGRPNERDYWLRRPEHLLRPEVVESLYLLWKTTGDAKWREKGWQVCNAFDGHSRTPVAYSTLRRIDQVPVRWTDSMPSWFLAETLKYCFLLASDKDLVPLDRYTLNTEGHLMPQFAWEGWKKFKVQGSS
ncbi:hypothetical protein FRB95_014091 [Tulasnella sp. JGI-2019a]|nr:hypothetical protein FRB95_014091 [Tulasnella sp. JGI-2019a]